MCQTYDVCPASLSAYLISHLISRYVEGREKEVVKGLVATRWQQEKIMDNAFSKVIGG